MMKPRRKTIAPKVARRTVPTDRPCTSIEIRRIASAATVVRDLLDALTHHKAWIITATQCRTPEVWSPDFDRGFVEGGGEVPPSHTRWRLFPVGVIERNEVAPDAYRDGVDGGKARA